MAPWFLQNMLNVLKEETNDRMGGRRHRLRHQVDPDYMIHTQPPRFLWPAESPTRSGIAPANMFETFFFCNFFANPGAPVQTEPETVDT